MQKYSINNKEHPTFSSCNLGFNLILFFFRHSVIDLLLCLGSLSRSVTHFTQALAVGQILYKNTRIVMFMRSSWSAHWPVLQNRFNIFWVSLVDLCLLTLNSGDLTTTLVICLVNQPRFSDSGYGRAHVEQVELTSGGRLQSTILAD